MTFQHEVTTCEEFAQEELVFTTTTPSYFDDGDDNEEEEETANCYVVKISDAFTDPSQHKKLWHVYVVVVQVVLRVLPTLLIFFLNVYIYLRLRDISRRRRAIKRASRGRKRRREKEKAKAKATVATVSGEMSTRGEEEEEEEVGDRVIPSIVVDPPSEEEVPEPDADAPEERMTGPAGVTPPDIILHCGGYGKDDSKQNLHEDVSPPPPCPPSLFRRPNVPPDAEEALRLALRLSLSVSFADSADVISLAPSTACSSYYADGEREGLGFDVQDDDDDGGDMRRPRKWIKNMTRCACVLTTS